MTMESDRFRVTYHSYVPSWRRGKARQEPLAVRLVLAVCSVVGIVLVLIPTRDGYQMPMSMEWASGSTLGFFRLAGIVLTLLVLGSKLFARRCYVDGLACLVLIVALTYLATSPPLSARHLGVFIVLVALIVAWHWLLAVRLEDLRIVLMSALVTAVAFGCAIALGPGERILAALSIITANLAFYEHAPPAGEKRQRNLYIA